MTLFTPIDQVVWGHRSAAIQPTAVIDQLAKEVSEGLDNFEILTINHQPCNDADGYERVNVELCVSKELFDLFLNGNAGYRAQYAQGVQRGEAYNRTAVDAILDTLVASNRFGPGVDSELCRRSLQGRYTKFWFPKFLTDPAGQNQLLALPEVIKWPQWMEYWGARPRPRKGLLAPQLDEPTIQLNGSFVRRSDWRIFEQKPGRSDQLMREGWT